MPAAPARLIDTAAASAALAVPVLTVFLIADWSPVGRRQMAGTEIMLLQQGLHSIF